MEYVKAKKYLGQHFLRDENIALKIVDSLCSGLKNVVEVGPGTGVLTKYLIEKPDLNLKVVEVDNESVEYLRNKYASLENKIIEKDFLKLDLNNLFDSTFAVIGNFPYNISSQILFKVLENRNKALETVGMFQKEVAERIVAKHGSKTYGILSVLIQTYYNTEYLFTVHENVFSPPPKVKSAVIRLKRNNRLQLEFDEKLYFAIVKTAFNQRRKTLRNALKPILGETRIDNSYMDKRAEQLSVEDFITLSDLISATLNTKNIK